MKFNWKAGILLVMLVMPVFIWLFLKFFGQNQFDIPVYYQDGVPAAAACQGNTDNPYLVKDFSLTNIDSAASPGDLLSQHISVVSFFEYPCDSVCTLGLEALARIQQAFEQDTVVQLLSIEKTGKPVEITRQLSKRYQAKPRRWYFLTGEPEQVETLSQCGFVLNNEPDIQHPIVLLDRQKRIRGYYDWADKEDVERLILEIRILLYNIKS